MAVLSRRRAAPRRLSAPSGGRSEATWGLSFLAFVERQHDTLGQRVRLAGEHEAGRDLGLVEREVALHAHRALDDFGAAGTADTRGARERHFEPGGRRAVEDARL